MNYRKPSQATINYSKLPNRNILIILFFTIIFAMPVNTFAAMQSPSYRIDYERISSGGGTEGSNGYNLLETLGEFGAGLSESDSYKAGAGEAYGLKADVPPTPSLINNGSYNSLNFRLNRGREYSDDPAMIMHMKFNTDPTFDFYTTAGTASEEINTTSTIKIAEKFQTGTSTDYLSSVDVYQTAGDDLVGNITIETDNNGQPSGVQIGDNVLAINLNAGSATHVKLASSTQVVANNIYWLVFTSTSGSGSFQGNTTGERDQTRVYDGNSWDLSSSTESLYFKVFDRSDDVRDDNHGQIVGAITADGRYGRGLDFDGSNDYVFNVDTGSLDSANTVTLEAWIKPDDTPSGDEYIIYRANAYYLKLTSGLKPVGGVWNGVAWVSATSRDSITADGAVWTHLALAYDKNAGGTDEIKIYVAGINQGVGDNSTAIPSAASNLYIGAGDEAGKDNTPENWFDGVIDEAAIYDRTLTAHEISQHSQIANPADAEYAIAISDDNWATTNYIQTDNTIGVGMVWQTYANWGSGTGKLLSGLLKETTYQIKVKARQGGFTETEWSEENSAKTSAVSLGFSLSSNSCDFGSLVPNLVSQCQTILMVDTNADSGYQTTIIEDGDMRNQSGFVINDVSDGAVDRGVEYGIRTSGSIDGQMSDQDYAITTSAQAIAAKSGPAFARQITVTYKLVVNSTAEAGEYSQAVTYATTGTY